MGATRHVVAEVIAERWRQDEKFGEQNCDDGMWALILMEECGEAAHDAIEAGRAATLEAQTDLLATMRDELIQVAAVAVAWVEALDRRSMAT